MMDQPDRDLQAETEAEDTTDMDMDSEDPTDGGNLAICPDCNDIAHLVQEAAGKRYYRCPACHLLFAERE